MKSVTNTDIEQIAEMQEWLFDSLVFPNQVDPLTVKNRILDSPNQQAKERLSIYQRSYILRLCKCLEEQFPALCYALGKPLFDDFAIEYLKQYPSDSYTLYELGRRFTFYLQESRPDKNLPIEEQEQWIDFMMDLANYEYELFCLFDTKGNEGKPWPNIKTDDSRLKLQPCFSITKYNYPVAAYYHQVRDGNKPSLPSRLTSYIAICRKDYQTASYPVNYVHYVFLKAMQENQNIETSISTVAETLKRNRDEVEKSWQEDVKIMWLRSGFFVKHD